ncbi:tetratricopeptide repeat protein [Comamonas sp. GB3 AK4-5]|uniref:tetratricopeptide repeat protein n=1 Tax=Comamonas sp. GB3 AK4-5 TaxID=3231487 RepID=UPI00351DD000
MRQILWTGPLFTLALLGCAAQSPADQVTRPEVVRICQGNACADQHRSTATFQGTPVDAEAERRMQALAQLAERDPKAAYDLGMRLLRGDGVERNSYQAIEWLRKSGDGGHLPAQVALGRMYLTGVEEMGADPGEAESWLDRAAARGDKESQRLLKEAQAAKQDEQRLYQIRDTYRKSWGGWYYSVPYYWVWGPSGWYLR